MSRHGVDSDKLIIIFLLQLVGTILCHVALTFPPARKYDLDFLDSSRTKAPCGMPKGNVHTAILAGSKLNVTWHLGYLHRGGFKLELLDELERPVLDLTPSTVNSEFVASDTSAQLFQVQLPRDYSCKNCTIRLIREAMEWGSSYKFWSCADVDIKNQMEFKETCSNHGRYLLGRCKCDRLYYGNRCQYKDECWENGDCGIHGKCIDIKATTAPRKQCYCLLGWFGPNCNTKSPVKSTEIDFSIYTRKDLSKKIKLYWRIIWEHNEIEIVMVANGTSYVALGWRPRSLNKTCKNWPQIGPTLLENIKSESKSEPKLAAVEASEPINEPDSLPEIQSQMDPTEEPTFEPSSSHEPVGTRDLETTEKSKYRKSLYSRRSAPHKNFTSRNLDGVIETSISSTITSKQGRKRRSSNEPESSPKSNVKPEPSSESEPTSEQEPIPEPSTEPSTNPEHTQTPVNAKSEPEVSSEPILKSDPTAEVTTEPVAEIDSKSEPVAEIGSKSEPVAEIGSKSEPGITETTKESTLNPYTPRHDFNPMDCTDMIIGTARETASRIGDYYTRDRSTPRSDSFWGGKNDLTAAMAFEKDGVTTMLFRKKLKAVEPSDHSFEEETMHVIYAQGQELGQYIHVPESGIDSAQIKDFYRPDELKYHGHAGQRGVVHMNFFEGNNASLSSEAKESAPIKKSCGGFWSFPRTCDMTNNTCEYVATWDYLPKNDEIRFTIKSSHVDTWTGIAFSDDEKMSQTDAILGWVDKTGRPFLMDTWISGYTQPLLDASQGIYNTSGRIVDGITTLSFTRKAISDDLKDLSFSEDHCLYIMYPVKGGAFNGVNKKIRKHELIPKVSSERVCIHSCPDNNMANVAVPESVIYKIAIKLLDSMEYEKAPKHGSREFEKISNLINKSFQSTFLKIKGYKKAMLSALSKDGDSLIASINLKIEDENGDNRALNDDSNHVRTILQPVSEIVNSGIVGSLKLDPKYLIFEQQMLTSDLFENASTVESRAFEISVDKMTIILACIAALVFVVALQASCTIYKAATKHFNDRKDHLIPNSAWKDYSTASTNYAFETNEEKRLTNNEKNQNDTLLAKKQVGGSRSQHKPTTLRDQSQEKYVKGRSSLQLPGARTSLSDNPLDRSTFSLPRTSYDRHQPTSDHIQPDFYFMPSQRKYSGEVVRVYVDYTDTK